MRKITKKSLFITALLLYLALLPMTARAADVPVIIYQGETTAAIQSKIKNAMDSLTGGDTVTVTGSKENPDGLLTLDIPENVTVKWKAFYTGTRSGTTANTSTLVKLNGNGTFEVSEGGWVENSGSGRTIWATEIAVNAAVIVSGGTVAANTGCAIYMEGENNIVTVGESNTATVSGGTVYNKSQSNVQPVIYMKNEDNKGRNVVITGTGSVSVRASEGNGFAIQTYGNVLISGDATVYVNGAGRAINALGVSSEVNVTDNSTVWTKTGITIRTGGDNPPSGTLATVTVSGNALVYNEGNASYPVIWMEKDNPNVENVTISGNARVEARGVNGRAIDTKGSVLVEGGTVAATVPTSNTQNLGAGRTINAGGSVTVNNGGTVSATTGLAINAGGSVTVNGGGFVFAYGKNINDVVRRVGATTGDGIITGWNRPSDDPSPPPNPPFEYDFKDNTDLNAWNTNGNSIGIETVYWAGDGVRYPISNDASKIFSIKDVIVITPQIPPTPPVLPHQVGLIFDVKDGKFHLDGDDGTYFEQFRGITWDSNVNNKTLTLKDFTWNVSGDNEPRALTILYNITSDDFIPFDNDLTIKLEGDNSVTATGAEPMDSFGIISFGVNLTIEGDGTLYASGSANTDDEKATLGIFVDWGDLTINGGKITTVGVNNKTGGAGIWVLGDIKINRGTVTAFGAGPPGSESSIGIVAVGVTGEKFGFFDRGGKIEINGGTVVAHAVEQAIFAGYYEDPYGRPIPDPENFDLNDEAYLYWRNNTVIDPRGKGTLFYRGSGATEYNYDADDKYVKIVASLFALTEEKTIIDDGTPPPDGQTGTITLFGDKVNESMNNVDVTDWFIDLPPGVTVRADAKGGDEIINLTFIVPVPDPGEPGGPDDPDDPDNPPDPDDPWVAPVTPPKKDDAYEPTEPGILPDPDPIHEPIFPDPSNPEPSYPLDPDIPTEPPVIPPDPIYPPDPIPDPSIPSEPIDPPSPIIIPEDPIIPSDPIIPVDPMKDITIVVPPEVLDRDPENPGEPVIVLPDPRINARPEVPEPDCGGCDSGANVRLTALALLITFIATRTSGTLARRRKRTDK